MPAIWNRRPVARMPPIAFTYGLGALLLFPLRFRGTAVTLANGSAETLLDSIDRVGVTHCSTVPNAYRSLFATSADPTLTWASAAHADNPSGTRVPSS